MSDIKNKKQNPLTVFILAFVEVFMCAFRGMKIVFIELPAGLFNAASGGVDKAYKQTKYAVAGEYAYQKKEKKVDQTNVGPKQLALLEEKRKALLAEMAEGEVTRSEVTNVYRYTIRQSNGRFVQGTFDGFSKYDVFAFLENEGHLVYDIETSKWITFMYGTAVFGKKKMSNKDLIFWLTQLSTYVKAGVALTDAVRMIANQMSRTQKNKKVFETIVYELTMGESFSSALSKQDTVFPGLLINMIKSAEATGDLATTLDDLAEYYNQIDKTNREMRSAMMYPTIVAIFAIVVITFIMLYVVPQFMGVYDSIGASLNSLTATVVAISDFIRQNAITIIIVLIVIIIALRLAFLNLKAFKRALQTLFLRIPGFGKLFIYKEMHIISKTFASLMNSDVFITDSMEILFKITDNEIYKEIIFEAIENLSRGDKVSDAFKDHWAVPDVAYQMLLTGEATGEVGPMMSKVADYFHTVHKSAVNSLKTLIEPIMIVALAVIVGVVVLAVIVPVFELYSTIQM